MPTAELKRPTEFPLPIENSAVGKAGEQLQAKVNEGLRDTLGYSVFWTETVVRSHARAAIESLSELHSNWDSYGAPVPNQHALVNATRILKHMRISDLASTRIVPSAEGGVGFCFSSGDRYADIESPNEGNIIGVRYAGMQTPVVIETDGTDESIESALEEIRKHLRA